MYEAKLKETKARGTPSFIITPQKCTSILYAVSYVCPACMLSHMCPHNSGEL